MKIIRQLLIILLFFILGELAQNAISWLFPTVFVPGTVLGMLFLLTALLTRIVPMKHVESVGGFLIANMSFFFIPAAVSVLEYLDILQAHLWKILLIIFSGVFISFFAVAGSVRLTMHWQSVWRKRREDRHA
ncbi:MAG TPA: CidA/LrgA family protein [Candidatus Izemoplasmatales bacterium]|nr:CidA/LrgA family protein [Bacillota bacterium]HRY78559.1 CidA/LrgA family protein [Candidatus Izemoplasmatales bacterium]